MERKMTVIRLRPHHGLCLQFFQGKGYSERFTAHMGKVKAMAEDHGEIRLTTGKDEICGHCPNLKNGVCITDDKVQRYDRQVLELCGLRGTETLSWEEFSLLIRQKILLAGRRADVCPDCQWEEICSKKEGELRRV